MIILSDWDYRLETVGKASSRFERWFEVEEETVALPTVRRNTRKSTHPDTRLDDSVRFYLLGLYLGNPILAETVSENSRTNFCDNPRYRSPHDHFEPD